MLENVVQKLRFLRAGYEEWSNPRINFVRRKHKKLAKPVTKKKLA
jgi:hypothetical protein